MGDRDLTVFVVVDPDDAIDECDGANEPATRVVACRVILR